MGPFVKGYASESQTIHNASYGQISRKNHSVVHKVVVGDGRLPAKEVC
jgi:hypothetical protein